MADWLDDFIGKVPAVDGVDLPLVGRINFRSGAGILITPQVVEGATNEPTTLNLTIAADTFFNVHSSDPIESEAAESGFEVNAFVPLLVDDEGNPLPLEVGDLHIFTVTLNLTAKTLTSEGAAKSVAYAEICAWRHDLDNAYVVGSGDGSGNLPPVRVLCGGGTLTSWENAPITTELSGGSPYLRIQSWAIPNAAAVSITVERKTVPNVQEPA